MILANVGLRPTGALIPSGGLLKTPKGGAGRPFRPPLGYVTSLFLIIFFLSFHQHTYCGRSEAFVGGDWRVPTLALWVQAPHRYKAPPPPTPGPRGTLLRYPFTIHTYHTSFGKLLLKHRAASTPNSAQPQRHLHIFTCPTLEWAKPDLNQGYLSKCSLVPGEGAPY